MRLWGLVVVLACAAGLAGCAVSSVPVVDPGPTASANDVAQVRDSDGAPIFWLGTRSGGERVTSLEHRHQPSMVSYGEPDCDESGCSWTASVYTDRRRDLPSTNSKRSLVKCWHRLGRAVAFECPKNYPEPEVTVWTGSVQVSAGGYDVTASSITPMNATARDLGFTRPRRFTCAEVKQIAEEQTERPALRTLPRVLAPRGCPVP